MNSQTQIKCPNCGNEIDVNDILKHQLEESIKKEYQEKYISSQKELQDEIDVNDILKHQLEESIKISRKNYFLALPTLHRRLLWLRW